MQYQGIDEQRIVNNGLHADRQGPRHAARRHQRRPLPAELATYKPHDILLCIGTGKTVNDAERLKYHGDQFFLKTAEEMAEVFGDYPDALREHAAHRRALQRRPLVKRATTSRTSTCPAGFTLDDYFEHIVREGFAQRLPRLRRARARRAAAAHARRVRASGSRYEIAMIKQMEYPGTS